MNIQSPFSNGIQGYQRAADSVADASLNISRANINVLSNESSTPASVNPDQFADASKKTVTDSLIQLKISFMPPPALELIQQDNQARPLIDPASDAKSARSQKFGGTRQEAQPEIYTRQGLVSVASKTSQTEEAATDDAKREGTGKTANAPTKNMTGKELSLEQQEEFLHLQQRDQEVRVHEQQHASVGGQHTARRVANLKPAPLANSMW